MVQHVADSFRYPVMEHFYTIQGEGYHTGKPAYFIRLGGCDVGCVWCDVKDSWDAASHPMVETFTMAGWLDSNPSHRVVITGGEPLMYDLQPLCDALHGKGATLHLETSGAYPLSGSWEWICVSPKKFKAPLEDVLAKAHELKVIVYNNSDFDWALQHAAHVSAGCRLFVQPEHSVFEKVMPGIVDFVKQHPEWRISLQSHKFIHVP
jgi:organic radical activating enzyme